HAATGADDQVWLTPGRQVPQRPTRVPARARAARRAPVPVRVACRDARRAPAPVRRPRRHKTATPACSEQAERVEEAHPHPAYQQPLTGLDLVEVLLGGVSGPDPPA